jgi:hypothetical protein
MLRRIERALIEGRGERNEAVSEIQTQIEHGRRQEISGAQLLRGFVGYEDRLFFGAPGFADLYLLSN